MANAESIELRQGQRAAAEFRQEIEEAESRLGLGSGGGAGGKSGAMSSRLPPIGAGGRNTANRRGISTMVEMTEEVVKE